MGDPKCSQLYTSLLAYLEKHRQELAHSVKVRGMSAECALNFESNRVLAFSLEVWQSFPHGYDLDMPSIGCCTTKKHCHYSEARQGLREAKPGSADPMAIQLGQASG
jgi:hypothetical protein